MEAVREAEGRAFAASREGVTSIILNMASNYDYQGEIVERGGIARSVSLLLRENEAEAVDAATTLFHLGERFAEEIGNEGGVEALVGLTCNGTEEQREAAINALKALTRSKANQARLKAAGGLAIFMPRRLPGRRPTGNAIAPAESSSGSIVVKTEVCTGDLVVGVGSAPNLPSRPRASSPESRGILSEDTEIEDETADHVDADNRPGQGGEDRSVIEDADVAMAEVVKTMNPVRDPADANIVIDAPAGCMDLPPPPSVYSLISDDDSEGESSDNQTTLPIKPERLAVNGDILFVPRALHDDNVESNTTYSSASMIPGDALVTPTKAERLCRRIEESPQIGARYCTQGAWLAFAA